MKNHLTLKFMFIFSFLCLFRISLPVSGGEVEKNAIRIMSYNIRLSSGDVNTPNDWRGRRKAVVEAVRVANCDFVGLQEAVVTPVEDFNQVNYVAENLPEFEVYYRSREKTLHQGEATPILYRKARWEIDAEEHGVFWHSETPDVPGSKSWESACPRVATWGCFHELAESDTGQPERTGRRVYVLNTHLDHVSGQARLHAAMQIAEFLAKRKDTAAPVFALGDFNAGEGSDVIRFLKGQEIETDTGKHTSPLKLVDTFRAAHPDEKNVGTFNSFRKPGAGKIDYIFTLPQARVLSAEIMRQAVLDVTYPSDHYPVTAECSL